MILVIDNFDSFTYNLVDYFGKISAREIKVVRNNALTPADVGAMAPAFIVISPGPKTPSEAGISEEVIAQFGPRIPTLGVCLGHQAIGEVFGSQIVGARTLMHGKISKVVHNGDALFAGIPSPFEATRYHSLVIKDSSLSKDLVALAHSSDDREIMAVKHVRHPIYGVQFHPESICTPEGIRILMNFLAIHGEPAK